MVGGTTGGVQAEVQGANESDGSWMAPGPLASQPPYGQDPAAEPDALPEELVSGVRPFESLVIVELAGSVAGAYAGKLFAGFGATVVKVEPPEATRCGPWASRLMGWGRPSRI